MVSFFVCFVFCRKQLQADIDESTVLTGTKHQQHRDAVESSKPETQRLENAKSPATRPSLLVYIYDVPSMFTTDLLHCAINNTDNGYQRTEDRFTSTTHSGDDVTSVVTSLEVLFHRRLLSSKYLTSDATKADVLFIPFYASLACNCRSGINVTVADLHSQLWQFVDQTLPYFRNGKPSRPHFMVLGKPERYHWTKICPLLRDKEHTSNIIFISPDRENNVELRNYAGRGTSQIIVAPYPAHEPITSGELPRNIFAFFYDNTFSGRGVRASLREQITNIHISSSSETPTETDTFAVRFIDNLNQVGSSQSAYQWMRRSVFCLLAPADTHIQQYFYDAIAAGCLPVTFLPKKKKKHKIQFPFDDKVDYSSFTINIPPEEVLSGDQNTTWFLSTLPKLRIAIMQKKLKQYASQLLYSSRKDTNDAFEMIVAEMVQISS